MKNGLSKVETSLLLSLSSSLWEEERGVSSFQHWVENNPLSAEEWISLRRLAKQQTLTGIVADAVSTLPERFKPPVNQYLPWLNEVAKIEEKNRQMNRLIVLRFSQFAEAGFKAVLLKGQTVAMRYPQPLHRMCGDVDVFVPSQVEELKELLLREGAQLGAHHGEQESVIYDGDFIVEIHHRLAAVQSPFAQKFFDSFDADSCSSVKIASVSCDVLPKEFEIVYLTEHIVQHVIERGIGLRQICDWSLFLCREREIQIPLLRSYLDRCGLMNSFLVLGALAVHYLQLPKECFPFDFTQKHEKGAEKLMKDIFLNGNFGKHRKTNNHTGFWNSKWDTFLLLKRCFTLHFFASNETIWRPIMKFVRFVKYRKYRQ